MLTRLKKRWVNFRNRDERVTLIEAVHQLIQTDTQRLIDLGYTALDEHYVANGIIDVSESEYANIRDRYMVDYSKQLSKFNTSTLMLLHDTFSSDPTGLNRLVHDAGTLGDVEAFVNERILFPIDIGFTRWGAKRTYVEARECLGVPDLTALPLSDHDGVSAVLTVAAFWGRFYTEERYMNGVDDEPQMTQMLASLLMEMPDRVEDTLGYFNARELKLSHVDVSHLREVLLNESKPLSSGVL